MLVKLDTKSHEISIIDNNHIDLLSNEQTKTIVFHQNAIGQSLPDTNNYCYNSKLEISALSLKLTTESSGYYQLYYYELQDFIYISDSIFLLLPHVADLSLNKQNCLEYINMSTVLGNETVFNEIKKFEPHTVYDLKHHLKNKISAFSYKQTETFESLLVALEHYFLALKKTNQTIYVDLSGGFDTRTVLSCLIHFEIPYELVTNNRSESVSPDIKIAKIIAAKLNKKLHVINIEPSSINPNDTAVISSTQMVRGFDIACRLKEEIINKSKLSGIKVGGWGAEMMRNQYGSTKSFEQIVDSFAYKKLKLHNNEDDKAYLEAVSNKLKAEMIFWELEPDMPHFSQLLHYRIKARHWAGSMLSMRNNFTPTLFPFYHPNIALISNLLPDSDHYQTELMNKFAPVLAGIPFSSADKPIDKLSGLIFYFQKLKRKVFRKLGLFSQIKSTTDYPFPVNQIPDNKEFANFVGVSKDYLIKTNQLNLVTKYFVVLSLFNNYIDRE